MPLAYELFVRVSNEVGYALLDDEFTLPDAG
jgi:hypothetical protein